MRTIFSTDCSRQMSLFLSKSTYWALCPEVGGSSGTNEVNFMMRNVVQRKVAACILQLSKLLRKILKNTDVRIKWVSIGGGGEEPAAILDLMRRMLVFSPEDQLSAEEILKSESMVKWCLPEFERSLHSSR